MKIFKALSVILLLVIYVKKGNTSNVISVFGTTIQFENEIIVEGEQEMLIKTLEIQNLYNVVAPSIPQDKIEELYQILNLQIHPSTQPPEGVPVMLIMYTTNNALDLKDIDQRTIFAFSLIMELKGKLKHYYFEKFIAGNGNKNTSYRFVPSLTASIGGLSSDLKKAIHYAFFGSKDLPTISATYLFRSSNMNNLNLDGDETSLIAKIGADHCRQSGLKLMGQYGRGLEIYHKIGGGSVCPSPCPSNDRDICNDASLACDWGSGCSTAQTDEASQELSIFDIEFNYDLMYNFRDNLLDIFPKGRNYIGYYYTISSVTTKQDLDSNIVQLNGRLLDELYRVMSIFLKADSDKSSPKSLTNDLQKEMLDVILHESNGLDNNLQQMCSKMYRDLQIQLTKQDQLINKHFRLKILNIINHHRDPNNIVFDQVCDNIFDRINTLMINETDPVIVTASFRKKALEVIKIYRSFSLNEHFHNAIDQIVDDLNEFLGLTFTEVLKEIGLDTNTSKNDSKYCDTYKNKRSIIPLGEIPVSDFQFSLFPNPASESIRISFSSPVKSELVFELYSIDGVRVSDQFSLTAKANQKKVITYSTSYLPAGLYIIKIRKGNEDILKKIVLTK